MPRNLAQKTYDVFIADGSRWVLDAQYDVRSQAEARAEEIIAEAKVPGVRVVAENHRTGDEEVLIEEQIDVSDKPLKIVPIETAPVCKEIGDYYAFPARQAAGKLLRQYLDEKGQTALELAFDFGALRLLERNDNLFPPAMQRVGAVQAKETGEKPMVRTDALYAAFEQIKENARVAGEDTGRAGLLEDGDLAALMAKAPKGSPDKDVFILGGIAMALRARGDWSEKLRLLILMIEKSDAKAVAKYVDDVMAEILDSNQAVTEVFGGFGDSISAFRALVHVTQGRCQVKNERSCLESLNNTMASTPLEQTKGVLLDQVARTLGGIRPLTREGPEADAEAFRAFVRDCVLEAGLVGGPAMAAAVAGRARIVLAEEDDLTIAEAIEQVTGLMPNRAVRLGYLLDLIASPMGQEHEQAILSVLGRLVQQLTSLSSLMPSDASPEETQAVIDALSVKMMSDALPEEMRALFSETLDRLVSKKDEEPTAEGDTLVFKMEDTAVANKNGIQRREVKTGELLFEEGDPADFAYLVLDGNIEIFRKAGNEETVLAKLGRGEIVGEMSLIDNQPRMASARVTDDTKLSVITREDLSSRLDKLGGSDRVLRRIIDVFVQRLRGQGRMHE